MMVSGLFASDGCSSCSSFAQHGLSTFMPAGTVAYGASILQERPCGARGLRILHDLNLVPVLHATTLRLLPC
jgi:hypothetical protein